MLQSNFNKLAMPKETKWTKKVICSFCGQNLVLLKDWNKRCAQCKNGGVPRHLEDDIRIVKRDPAAIIETENGSTVFVDKFGKDVDNPGYDLQNDPRGKHFTDGRTKWEGKTIL